MLPFECFYTVPVHLHCTLLQHCVFTTRLFFSIRLQGNDAGLPKVETVLDVFDRIVQDYPNHPAMKIERDEHWVTWTYAEYQQDVKIAAKAFIKVCM